MKTVWKTWVGSAVIVAAGAMTMAIADPPATTRPTAEQQMDTLLGGPSNTARPMPTAQSQAPDKTGGTGAVAPGAPAVKLVREGTHFIERTGRLNHSTDGTQAYFTFDSDGRTMKDPPMIVLPNLKLTSMEGAVTAASKDVRFRISGTVTEYKGRNYILIDKALVTADIDQGL